MALKINLKKLISLFSLIFIFFFQEVYAIQCPPASAWSHVKGKNWQLNAEALQAGWEPITFATARLNELTDLPREIHLLIGVSETVHRFTTCGYALQPGDHSNVIAALNTQYPVNIKGLKPPFYCHHQRCFCDTTAGQPERCQWEWKS